MNALATKRIALYARVSTSKCEKCGKRQSDHEGLDHEYRGQDSEVQLRELREYVERRGWQITEIYTDSVSGTKNSRPGLDKLMGDAARRRFDVLVVWRFDRFARSVSHLLSALEQFQALGIDFVSLSENVDTSTPMGKMVFTVLGAVAELERSLIVERVKAGLRNARAKGKAASVRQSDSEPAPILPQQQQLHSYGLGYRDTFSQRNNLVGIGNYLVTQRWMLVML